MKQETLAIHAGFNDDPTTNAVAVPIYQTTSYSFRDTQHGADLFNLAEPGNIYTRIMNPTNDVVEQRVTQLEGGVGALALASGMAAITAAVQTLAKAGDNIVSVSQLYGGTYNFFAHSLPNQGIEARMASGDDIDALEALIDDNTKALFCESIGNPAGNIVDIQALSEILIAELKKRGIKNGICIIGEPTNMKIIDAHKGCYEYTTYFKGLAGHSSAPHKGVSAVEYASRYVNKLIELREKLREREIERNY